MNEGQTEHVTSIIKWHKPEDPPQAMQSVLVVFAHMVWAGVYANGTVVRLPQEDFSVLRLDECDWWCSFPDEPYPDHVSRSDMVDRVE